MNTFTNETVHWNNYWLMIEKYQIAKSMAKAMILSQRLRMNKNGGAVTMEQDNYKKVCETIQFN